MKWHDYPPSWKMQCRMMGLDGPETLDDLLVVLRAGANTAAKQVAITNSAAAYQIEQRWTQSNRPFYDVYPSVTEAFLKIDLAGVHCEQVSLPIPDLMIRFQVGHELQASAKTKVLSILVGSSKTARTHNASGNRYDGLMVTARTHAIGEDVDYTVAGVVLQPGTTIEHHLQIGRDRHHHVPESGTDWEAIDNIYRLIVCLCLLNDNPDLIEAEPLESDRRKWEQAYGGGDEETKGRLLDRAMRRGLRRWSVGKRIEVAPGFRRPHFSIRWMGHGEPKQPVLRPIKGCLVRRAKITDVPTGYLDEPLEAVVLDD